MTTIEMPSIKGEVRAGQPIVAIVRGALSTPRAVVVSEGARRSSFLAPVEKAGEGTWRIEFTLASPGPYRLEANEARASIVVVPQVNLTFQKEFGIFSVVTALLVGGMLIWLRARQNHSVGPAWDSGRRSSWLESSPKGSTDIRT